MYVHYTVLSKELLDYWIERAVKVGMRQRFIREIQLSTVSAKTDNELSFLSDCAYVWEKDSKCITMKWEELDKLLGSFTYISVERFKKWFISEVKANPKHKNNENRLQKQETHVVRGDDTEGVGVQSRKRKASVTIGYLSNKAIKG
jgi:hypothetical protein